MTALLDTADVHPSPAARLPGIPAPPAPLIPQVVLYAGAGIGLIAAWVATIWVSTHLSSDPLLHRAALFVHLATLVVGFGAVLTLDWFGLLWLLGKLPLRRVVEIAAHAHLMIWLGLAGLVMSGVMLQPELHQLTCIKLAAVLLIALNGLNAHHLEHSLAGAGAGLDRGLLVRVALTGAISQAGWWTACVIGFLNRG
ncbi:MULTISPECIES: hypothetical protein [Nocardioides]|uniref:Uncharacterized protein n=1 Tax=Nocardioides vastitatis TaxID=2568655 RepID=A0ABW0ZLA6_9ACTN|nr:hypothetical protein [Nocardioides sp.]THJ08454.1 hypothetical protein E7Z54_04510 [Nocardioides sp.]